MNIRKKMIVSVLLTLGLCCVIATMLGGCVAQEPANSTQSPTYAPSPTPAVKAYEPPKEGSVEYIGSSLPPRDMDGGEFGRVSEMITVLKGRGEDLRVNYGGRIMVLTVETNLSSYSLGKDMTIQCNRIRDILGSAWEVRIERKKDGEVIAKVP
jgi:hypothetical protein